MNAQPAEASPAAAELLSQLRPFRLPDPVTWWPPAPGWWLLMALLCIGCAALYLLWRRRRRRHAAARQAVEELDRIARRFADAGDLADYLRQLSGLLRRYALATWPRSEVAGLTGEAWLAFLDVNGGDGRFADGAGRHLIDAPYRRQADVPAEQIADLVRQWIERNREVDR